MYLSFTETWECLFYRSFVHHWNIGYLHFRCKIKRNIIKKLAFIERPSAWRIENSRISGDTYLKQKKNLQKTKANGRRQTGISKVYNNTKRIRTKLLKWSRIKGVPQIFRLKENLKILFSGHAESSFIFLWKALGVYNDSFLLENVRSTLLSITWSPMDPFTKL